MKNLILLTYFISFASIANTKLSCEPMIVNVSGKIKLETFPGIPNYESIKNGDEVETHFNLILDHPIDVLSDQKSNCDEPVNNVKVLQLVVMKDQQMVKLKKHGVGTHVQIQGTLFERFTGHHHSRVYLKLKR